MPPVPPTLSDKPRSTTVPARPSGERKGDLVVRVKYCNTLPDVPFDPKFIAYPFDPMRFVTYKPTSLERQFKHELLTEQDLGVSIDLINKDVYNIDPFDNRLHPSDERLLEEEVITPRNSKRSLQHAKNISWLRRTEYISTELNRFAATGDNQMETTVGASIKKLYGDEDLYKDKENQIAAIENTFDVVKRPITKHYSKPHVTPVEVLPVFPDFKEWKNPCTLVLFDTDPTSKGRMTVASHEEMCQALIRGMMDESGDQFVAYFLPNKQTIQQHNLDEEAGLAYDADEKYHYSMAREYNWSVKNKATAGHGDNFFMILRHGDGAYYNELETKVRLSKRRAKGGQQLKQTATSELLVSYRDFTDDEVRQQEERMMQLGPPLDDDLMEDDEDEDEVERESLSNEKDHGDTEDNKSDEGEEAKEKDDVGGLFSSSNDEDEEKSSDSVEAEEASSKHSAQSDDSSSSSEESP